MAKKQQQPVTRKVPIDDSLVTYCVKCGKRQISFGEDGKQIDSKGFDPHTCRDMGFPCLFPPRHGYPKSAA